MEPKCNYCDFFGEKYHCHNCKIINTSRQHEPKKIDCSLEELVEYINTSDNITERFNVGDYKNIDLYTGETIKIVLIDTYKDDLADGSGKAKTTFGVFCTDGKFKINSSHTNTGGWRDSNLRNVYMQRFYKILPTSLKDNIKIVHKKSYIKGGGDDSIVTTMDLLFAFSEIEVFGVCLNSYMGEGESYSYFDLPRSLSVFTEYTALRSVHTKGTACFRCVSPAGRSDYCGADADTTIAFGFCL